MTSSHSSVSSQLLTVLAVSFGPFSVGLSKGYSSPALASLAASNMGVTHQQTSWLASLSLLGALLGGLLSSLVLRAGRKNSLLLVSLPFSASWMLTVFATNVEMMFCTAFTAGLCSAIVIVVSQVSVPSLTWLYSSLWSDQSQESQLSLSLQKQDFNLKWILILFL